MKHTYRLRPDDVFYLDVTDEIQVNQMLNFLNDQNVPIEERALLFGHKPKRPFLLWKDKIISLASRTELVSLGNKIPVQKCTPSNFIGRFRDTVFDHTKNYLVEDKV